MDADIKVDYAAFQENKRERIEELRKPQGKISPRRFSLAATDHTAIPPAPTAPLVSAPTNHEVAGFMPGRLEFEHEIDNDAEVPVKDMEFGLVFKYGGDQQPASKPAEVKAAEEEEVKEEEEEDEEDEKPLAKANGTSGGKKKGKEKSKAKEKEKEKDEEAEEEPVEDVVEDEEELEVKLALLEIYFSKLDKREEAKDLIFDRCLTDYKKVCLISYLKTGFS
jgi:transcriptional adapter 2-alpha